MAGGQLWYWDEWERAVARREPLGHEQPGRYDRTTKKEFEFSWISDEKRSLCAFLPSLSPLAHLTHQTYYVQFALGCPITLSKHLSVQN